MHPATLSAPRLSHRARPAPPDERGPEPRRAGAAPDRAGDRRARCPLRGGRRGDRAGRRSGARRDAGPAPAGPRLRHLGPSRGHRTAAQGLGRRDLGRRPRVRHDRLPQGRVAGGEDVGRAFGTIGCRKGEWQVEITTYRSEAYDRESRKPEVAYGDSLEDDLVRRDFTVNAMAVTLPDRSFQD